MALTRPAPVPRRRTRLLRMAAGVVAAAAGLSACGGTIPLRTAGRPTPPTVAPSPSTPGGPLTPSAPSTTVPAHAPVSTPATDPGSTPTTIPRKITVPAISGRHAGASTFRLVMADAAARHWVHDTATVPAQISGEPATHFTSADGPGRGTQEITLGPLRGDIRVVGDKTWILGSAETLLGLFGVPAEVAGSVDGRWVLLHAGDSEYTTVTAGVTLASFLGEVAFSGPVITGTAVLDGTRRPVVEGRLATAEGVGDGLLYLTSGSRPLPLVWDQIGTTGTSRSTFSDWGQAVTVTAPAGAVALPAVAGGTTPAVALTPPG